MKLLIKDEHQAYWVMINLPVKRLAVLMARRDDWRYASDNDDHLKHLAYAANYVRLVRLSTPPEEPVVVVNDDTLKETPTTAYRVQWSEVQIRGAGIRFVTKIIDQFTLHESRVVPWAFLQKNLDQMMIAIGEEACI
jgi:hypothetical protein